MVLIEAEPRLGGHARTRTAGRAGDMTVDTGFIVFNHVNYPNLVALFQALDVPGPPCRTCPSGPVSAADGSNTGCSRCGHWPRSRRTLVDPRYLRMMADLLRFNARALEASREPGLTIGGLLEKLRLGGWFRDRYLLPMTGAIWSTPKAEVLDFPRPRR